MNKYLAICGTLFLAGCGSQHSLGSHTVRDVGDAHWVGNDQGVGAYLTPGQFTDIAKISEDSLAAEGPAQLLDVNINVGPAAGAQWTQSGPLDEAGTEFGLKKYRKNVSAGEADYYRLLPPSSGFMACLPDRSSGEGVTCLLHITYHGVNASIPIEPRALANWSEINTGLQNVVIAAVDRKCLIGALICS